VGAGGKWWVAELSGISNVGDFIRERAVVGMCLLTKCFMYAAVAPKIVG